MIGHSSVTDFLGITRPKGIEALPDLWVARAQKCKFNKANGKYGMHAYYHFRRWKSQINSCLILWRGCWTRRARSFDYIYLRSARSFFINMPKAPEKGQLNKGQNSCISAVAVIHVFELVKYLVLAPVVSVTISTCLKSMKNPVFDHNCKKCLRRHLAWLLCYYNKKTWTSISLITMRNSSCVRDNNNMIRHILNPAYQRPLQSLLR